MIISCKSSQGQPSFDQSQREMIREFCLKNEGKTVYIIFSKKKPPRTLLQNAYYHGVVVKMIADEIGDDYVSVHEDLKAKFCPEVTMRDIEDGREYKDKSTTRLNTKEFGMYIERCRAFAASFYNINIPDPDQFYSLP